MFSVYILKSEKDSGLYVGYSNNIKNRLIEHNRGKVAATKDRRPLKLIYCELYINKNDAMGRERYFKTGWGRNYVKKILSNTLQK